MSNEENPIEVHIEKSQHPRDIDIISYKLHVREGHDIPNIIKWCRKNFGKVGDGWDFVGTGETCYVYVWNSKLLTMWSIYH